MSSLILFLSRAPMLPLLSSCLCPLPYNLLLFSRRAVFVSSPSVFCAGAGAGVGICALVCWCRRWRWRWQDKRRADVVRVQPLETRRPLHSLRVQHRQLRRDTSVLPHQGDSLIDCDEQARAHHLRPTRRRGWTFAAHSPARSRISEHLTHLVSSETPGDERSSCPQQYLFVFPEG